jgi:hypothetical protein
MTKIQSTLDALSGYNRLCDKIIANGKGIDINSLIVR